MRVLLLEDDASYFRPLSEFLRESGHEVDLCRTTAELHGYIASPPVIGMALLDLFLGPDRPVDEGLNNISLVRKTWPFVPVLLFTGHAKMPWIDQAKSAGADAVIAKPVLFDREYYYDYLSPKILAFKKAAGAVDSRLLLSRLRELGEDDLIHRIIIPLFHEMGYHGLAAVSHHGPGEHGMDIGPFYQIDSLGDRTYCVAQVKARNITATAGSPCNVASVLNQVQIALRTEFMDAENQVRCADRAFLITSGQITPDARQTMKSWLKGGRQVSVIDGNRLLELLRRYELLHLLVEQRRVNCVKLIPVSVVGRREGVSWEQILRAVICRSCDLTPDQANVVYNAVLRRERLLPTTVGCDVALPHVYNTGILQQLIVVCVTASRYPWQSSDAHPVRLVILSVFVTGDAESVKIRRCVVEAVSGLVAERTPHASTPQLEAVQVAARVQEALDAQPFEVELLAGQELSTDSFDVGPQQEENP